MGLASSQTVRALGATVIAALALLLGSANAQGGVSDVPQVAVDENGNAYFTWLRSNGTDDIVQGRKRNANGTLTVVQNLSPAGRSAFTPQVAVDRLGNAYFTWMRPSGPDDIVQFRRRASNGTLGGVQGLSAPGQHAGRPQLAIDPKGAVDFVWERFDGADWVVQTRRRSAGGLLGTVDGLSDPTVTAVDPQVAVDPQGNAVFVWDSGFIQTRGRDASGELEGQPQNLGITNGVAGEPQVAIDPTGTASFVWAGLQTEGSAVVQTRRRTAEGFLSLGLVLSQADVAAADPQLGVDPLGNAYFVWERGDIIQTRRRAPDGTLTAVQNVTG